MAVDAAGTQQADDVELRAALLDVAHRVVKRLVLKETAVGDAVVDQRDVLHYHKAGPQVEVADLRVAHLTRRQADIFLGGAKQRPWAVGAPAIDVGRPRHRDAITGGFGAFTPAVENRQHHRAGPRMLSHSSS